MLTVWGRSQFDFRAALIDEIALEGLDGITLEGLWKRLSERPHFSFPLDDYGKRYLWNLVKDSGQVNFFKLPVPRNPLVVFNRFDYVDPDIGMVLEPDDIPEDLYPHFLVNDTAKKIKGSCQYYKEREDVTSIIIDEALSIEEAEEKWSASLVLVATQAVRELALMGCNSDPLITMAPTRYCILERIGRSRYLGEVTQGKTSLQLVGDDAKTLFYHRKFLASNGLVTKQLYHQKQGKLNCSGSLLHLPRFYIERKSKTLILTHQVVKILKTRPNFMADYEEIRKELGVPNMLKKLFKTPEFQRFIRTDLRLPYRSLYPTASIKEWRHKGKDKEKTIRALELMDPDLDENEIWMKDDEGDQEPDSTKDVKPVEMVYDRSILHQAFYVVDKAGSLGLSQMELSLAMGMNRLQSRSICRNLLKLGVVSTYLDDVGRQRVARYMSKRYVKQSKLAIEFNNEKNKLFALIKNGKKQKLALKRKRLECLKKKLETQKTETDSKETAESIDDVQQTTTLGGAKRKYDISLDTMESPPTKRMKTEQVASTSGEPQAQLIGTEICKVEESGPGIMEELQRMPHTRKEAPAITYRILKRANYIIQSVQTMKVIDDLTKLMKMMNEEEEKEGLSTKMDKKSLIRLLLKLNKDKYLKFIKITLKAGDREKVLNFVCDLSITQDHPIIQSAIEQHKLKFFLVPKDKLPKPSLLSRQTDTKVLKDHETDLIAQSSEELRAMSCREKTNTFQYERQAGKKYGFSPKFIRLRTLHQFLFYLVYGYEGTEGLDQAQAVAEIRGKGVELSPAEVTELPTFYKTDLSWKSFVPPLTQHAGWPQGWSIICDVLLRLPLSIFVRIINVTYNIPDLEAYLNHPMRKHYLIKSLPSHMRNNLLVARKYIFSFHEIVSRLCFMGLAQFGPQRLKDKDQIFMYLNRRTSLLDTTCTRPGYHQVSEDIQYIKHEHEFTSSHDVDKYWYELWNVCLNTPLGGRLCMSGQDIVLEVLANKKAMVDAVLPRTPAEATQRDTGSVPGDHRGAAGLDSAIFSHLKRNWNWTNAHTNTMNNAETDIRLLGPQPENQRMARIASLKPQPVRFDVLLGAQAMRGLTVSHIKVNEKSNNGEKKVSHKRHFPVATKTPKAISVRRRMMPRKNSQIRKKPLYDEVDEKAQRTMTRWRVQWDQQEDNLMLLCKVASMFICPNPRKQYVSFAVIRDILHEALPGSRTKTSRACQRRIAYMMKNATTNNSLSLHLEEVRQDEYLVKNFENTVQDARAAMTTFEELDKKISDRYKELVVVLKKKFSKINLVRNIPQSKFRSVIPDSLRELHATYEVLNASSLRTKGEFQAVNNVADICCATVNAIVHSTLCCITDKRSYMYQLFKIYQQYSDNLLRSVMAKIRADQMVSARKTYAKILHRTGSYLPVSSLPYQLSITYFYLLQTKYHFEVFYESHLMKQLIVTHHKDTELAVRHTSQACGEDRGMECATVDGGAAACLVEWYLKGNLTLNLQIPENIVILDPRIEKKDEAYKKIVARYQEIIRSCKLTSSLPPTSTLFTTPFFINNPSDPSLTEMDFDTEWIPAADNQLATVTDKCVNLPATNQQPADASDPAVVKKCRFKLDRETIRRCVPETPGEDWSDSDESSEEEMEVDSAPTRVSPSTQYVIARAASRIALFLMRDSLASTNMGELQHAHDYFVVNACQVFCKLHEERTSEEATVAFQGFHYLPDTGNYVPLLQKQDKHRFQSVKSAATIKCPLNEENILPILPEKTKQILNDMESELLVPDSLVSMEDVRELFRESGTSDRDWEHACTLMDWLQTKKEVGGTVKQLRARFSNLTSDGSLARLLGLLVRSRVLLRAGVTTTHYVHQNHRKPWLLHSYRLLRLTRERLMTQKTMVFTQRTKKRVRSTRNYAEALFGGHSGLQQVKKRVKRSRSLEDVTHMEAETRDDNKTLVGSGTEPEITLRATSSLSGECDRLAVRRKSTGDLNDSERQTITDDLEQANVEVQTMTPEVEGQMETTEVEGQTETAEVEGLMKTVELEQADLEGQTITSEVEGLMKTAELGQADLEGQTITSEVEGLMKTAELGQSDLEGQTITSEVEGQAKTAELGQADLEGQTITSEVEGQMEMVELEQADLEGQTITSEVEGQMEMVELEQVDLDGQTITSEVEGQTKTAELGQAVQEIDWSETELIHVTVRPWVRVDGTLNRRVLDRLLGSVLGHCLCQPCGSVKQTMDRFSPALQPYQTLELLEILQKLGCLQLQVVKRGWKTTLFSKVSPVWLEQADGTEDESQMVVQPAVDAIMRLGTFIGDKAYKKDFLS